MQPPININRPLVAALWSATSRVLVAGGVTRIKAVQGKTLDGGRVS
jgi:hypothetical protein